MNLGNRHKQTQVFACFTGLLAAILIIYYWRYLTGQASFYVYDLHAGWWPTFTYIGERLRSGQLPLWNPYSLNGVSQIDVIAPTVFYPLNIVFAFLPFNAALALLLILQQLIAGCGMFALIVSFGWGLWAACLAGAAIALCGLMFSLQATPTLMGTIAWFIVAYWGQRLIATPRGDLKLFHTACAAVFTYVMIMAGVAEVFAPGLVFLGSAAVLEFLATRKMLHRQAAWILILRLLALGTGVLMSACAVLPAAEWSRLSPRAAGLSLHEIFSWSCNWYDLLCVSCIQPLGDLYVPTNSFRQLVATSSNQTPYLENAFIGPIILTAALWAAFDRSFKWRFVAAGVFIASLLLTVGWHFPPTLALVKALNLRAFRYPIKAMSFVSLSAAILAARGMNVFATRKGSAGNALACFIWAAGVLAGIVMQYLGWHPDLIELWQLDKLWLKVLNRTGSAILLSSAIGLVCVALFRARLKGPGWLRISAIILLASTIELHCLDAWQFNRHEGPVDYYTRPCLIADKVNALSRPDGSFRTCAVLYSNPFTPPAALHGPDIIAIYGYAINLMVPHTNMCHHIRNVYDFTVGQTADHDKLWHTVSGQYFDKHNSIPLGTLFQAFGVRLMAAQPGHNVTSSGEPINPYPPLDERYFKPLYVDKPMNIAVYEIQNVLPRAYFAASTRALTHEQAMDQLLNIDKSGFDPHKVTLLENVSAQSPIEASQLQQSHVEFQSDLPEDVSLNVFTPVANFLVLDDQFYPGWHAFVDGREVPISRANAVLRAVFVPAGRHLVEFTYEPMPLIWGLFLHALAWLIVLKLIVISLVVRKSIRPA